MARPFVGSSNYWEERYASGQNSGKGSYGLLAQHKAEVLNSFVRSAQIKSVIEFGSGDGNQLRLAHYPIYLGFDVSRTAIDVCRDMYRTDPTKTFKHISEDAGETADLALSLDVIFHLVEDEVFESYMHRLFAAGERFVIIYSSDMDRPALPTSPHVRHRAFTKWVAANIHKFELQQRVANKFGKGSGMPETSPSDFFIYRRVP